MSTTMQSEVIIIGAGPTGLFLAGELARAGVRCRVIERRRDRTEESRALGLHARTLEVLAMRGMAEGFLAQGKSVHQVRINLGGALLDLTKLDSPFAQLHILAQGITEQLLEEQLVSLGVTVERGVRCVSAQQDADRVLLTLADETREWQESVPWVVGCDGSRSAVRESMGIGFEGKLYPYTILVADVKLRQAPTDPLLIHVGRQGLVVSTDFGNGWYRLGVIDRTKEWSDAPVTLDEVRESLTRMFGVDVGPSEPLWTSRFRIQERQAATYRQGRVLLAGDAAHVHSPLGGQGLNLGVQDAMNLGWKLASVIHGHLSPEILDTYVAERRRVSTGVVKATDIATRVMTSGNPFLRALRRIMVPTMVGRNRTHLIAVGYLSGVAIRYQDKHSSGAADLVGLRMPDADLTLADGSGTSLFRLMHAGNFVLIDQTGGDAADRVKPWGSRVHHVVGTVRDRTNLASRDLILIRPDGYCAWSGQRQQASTELPAALLRWVGPSAEQRPDLPPDPD